jgi:hypothetical protein
MFGNVAASGVAERVLHRPSHRRRPAAAEPPILVTREGRIGKRRVPISDREELLLLKRQLDLADRIADARIAAEKRDRARAFGLIIVTLATAVVFFSLGNPEAGTAFTSVPLFALIATFLHRS